MKNFRLSVTSLLLAICLVATPMAAFANPDRGGKPMAEHHEPARTPEFHREPLHDRGPEPRHYRRRTRRHKGDALLALAAGVAVGAVIASD